MKRFFLILLLIAAIERFCHWQTGGFALSKMTRNPPQAIANASVENSLFSEPLTFLGAGNQFYAFETADHQHVVKFMKFSRRRPLPWLEQLPLPSFLGLWKQNYLAQRAKRLCNLQKSSALALSQLTEETGLIPVPPVQKTITLIDKLGIRHQIDLSKTVFYVQKKSTLFTVYFNQNPSQAHALILSYMQTVQSQCRKRICNLDPLIKRNYGVVDNRAVLLDIGSFLIHEKLRNPAMVQREIFLELLPLREWLQEHHPHHLAYFDAQLKELISFPKI